MPIKKENSETVTNTEMVVNQEEKKTERVGENLKKKKPVKDPFNMVWLFFEDTWPVKEHGTKIIMLQSIFWTTSIAIISTARGSHTETWTCFTRKGICHNGRKDQVIKTH